MLDVFCTDVHGFPLIYEEEICKTVWMSIISIINVIVTITAFH